MDQFLDSWHSYRFRYCSVNNLGFIIDFNALKTYEEHKRCCTIGTLLRISKFSETNLNELKEEIETNKEYKNIENLWEKCPADIFLSFAIENDIDLEKLKKKIK